MGQVRRGAGRPFPRVAWSWAAPPGRRRPNRGCLRANLALSSLRAEPGEGGRGARAQEGLETQGHLVHFEKFT